MSGAEVFLSYSSKDRELVDRMCAALEADGRLRCWMAPRDISPGRPWPEAIMDAIGAAKIMVVVMSSSSNASQQVEREVSQAVNLGVAVLPFRIEDITPSKSLQYFLATPHWLDAFTADPQSHFAALRQAIGDILDGAASAAAMPSAAPTPTPAASAGDLPQPMRPSKPAEAVSMDQLDQGQPGSRLGRWFKKLIDDT